MSTVKRLAESLYGKGGGKISVFYSGKNTGENVYPYVDYLVTNEDYRSETLEAIRSLSGINAYVGICGGGTQNIFLLSELLKNNDVGDVRLVDKELMQLHNFRKIAEMYNNSKNDGEYRSAIDLYARVNGFDYRTCLAYAPNRKRPRLERDVMVRLENGYIQDYFSGIKKSGRYFIYLSNALNDHLDIPDSVKVMHDIASNDKIGDGSVVLMVGALPADVIFFEKKGGSFSIRHGKMPERCDDIYQMMRINSLVLEYESRDGPPKQKHLNTL